MLFVHILLQNNPDIQLYFLQVFLIKKKSLLRLEAYKRNLNIQGQIIKLPESSIPEWPDTGFKHLQPEHRPHLPKITDDQLESYFIFIYRMASDKVEVGDIKGITKGKKSAGRKKS